MADDLLAREWTPERSRDLLDADPPAWAAGLWRTVRGLGWAELLLEGDDGGNGTVPDLCVIAESVGASTAPIPFVSAAVATWCAGGSTSEGEVGVVPVPAQVPFRLGATNTVSGTHEFVPYGDVADRLVLRADRPDGTTMLVEIPTSADGVEREVLRPLDNMPSASLRLHDVTVRDDEVVAVGEEAARRWTETMQRLTFGLGSRAHGRRRRSEHVGCRLRNSSRRVRSTDRRLPGHQTPARRSTSRDRSQSRARRTCRPRRRSTLRGCRRTHFVGCVLGDRFPPRSSRRRDPGLRRYRLHVGARCAPVPPPGRGAHCAPRRAQPPPRRCGGMAQGPLTARRSMLYNEALFVDMLHLHAT